MVFILKQQSSLVQEVKEKILAREVISRKEAIELYQCDLVTLGKLAQLAKRKKLPSDLEQTVFWNTNLHLNPTNVCVGKCNFCAFAKRPRDPEAYTMSIEEACKKAVRGHQSGATEVHIVGGLNPKTAIDYYQKLLRAIKKEAPALHIKAFTAVEIEFFAKLAKASYQDVLEALKDAGLNSMPGGGAEVFAKSVRDETCPDKIPAEKWLEIHEVAHTLGLRTNATMLAGIGESICDRIDHLLLLREQQAKSKLFQAFIPLQCHYQDTEIIQQEIDPITGIEVLKNIAIGQIVLHNFLYVKAYWVQLGRKVAQFALNIGANDLDGTVRDERITNAAGAKNKSTAQEELVFLIESAGFQAQERDTLYQKI